MRFEHFDYRVSSGENWDLYVSTYGYAYIKLWGMTDKIKKYFPNEKGYIYIGRKRVNFKKILYMTVYPNINLSDKVIFKIGPIWDIRNIYFLSRQCFVEFNNKKVKVEKDTKTGNCWLHTM